MKKITCLDYSISYFLILFLFMGCQCSDDCSNCQINNGICTNCDNNCKSNIINSICKYCNLEEKLYYLINDGTCLPQDSCTTNYIVFETKECVNSCGNKYKMGHYCYYQCPENSNSNALNDCKCIYKYHVEENNSKQEYICLSQYEECPSIYNYYDFNTRECKNVENYLNECNRKIKIEFRNDHSRIYRCSDECGDREILIDNKYCINICDEEKKYYYTEDGVAQCISDCTNVNKKELNRKCVDSCENPYPLFDEDKNLCVGSCTSNFVKKNDNSICVSESDASSCYTKDDETSEPKICYSSCSEIEGGYIYEKENKICSQTECNFYTDESPIKKCYNNKQDCYQDGFKYLKNKKCLRFCNDFINGNANEGDIIECFDNQDKCRDNGYYYYITSPKICYRDSCPNGLYPNQLDSNSKPIQDNNGNTCSDCSSNYPKISDSHCKTECDFNTECYFLEHPNECKLISVNFFYEDADKKICTNNCKSINKFYFDGNLKCVNKCISDGKPIFFDSSDNKCLSTCNGYYKLLTDDHMECKTSIPNGYFYKNEGEIIEKCNKLISSSDPKKCVESCNPNEKIDNNICLSICPEERKKYGNIRITIGDDPGTEIEVDKCVSQCQDLGTDYIYYIPKLKKCMKECSTDNYYIDENNNCYEKCEEGLSHIEPNTYECKDSCPSYYKKLKLLNSNEIIYICKPNCNNEEYILNNECYEKCPKNYNKIGKNNICIDNCDILNGEYFKKIETITSPEEYTIYKCISQCSNDYGIYETENKECFFQCPVGKKFVVQNEFDCLPSCPDTHPFYLLTEIDSTTGHLTCKDVFPCENGKFFLDGSCLTQDQCIEKGKNAIDPKKICIINCDDYSLKEKISDYFYKCLNNCDKYIVNDNECVEDCPNTNNFIVNGKYCKDECQETSIQNYYLYKDLLDYKIYICISSCNGPDYKLRVSDDNNKQCFKSCPSEYPYLSINDNICVSTCIENIERPYSLTIIENDITKKICSDSCNGKYFYTIDKICRDNCNNGDYALKNTLECVDKCELKNLYYYEGSEDESSSYKINTCVNECPHDRPYINNNRCSSSCDSSNPYSDNNVCVENCPIPQRKFFVSDFLSDEIDTQKKCLSGCPKKYPYYKFINGKYQCMHECNEKFISNPSPEIIEKECTSLCPNETYKYLVGNECLLLCPNGKYFVPKIGETCREICPDTFPFHEPGYYECKTSFDCTHKIADLDTKLCVESCPATKYTFEYKNTENEILSTVCLSSCRDNYGKYITPDNKCVSTCDPNLNLENDDSSIPYKCKCKYYYYTDLSTNKLTCLREGETCESTSSYKILKYNTKECLNKCDKILSLNENICYSEIYQCNSNEEIILMDNGQQKCNCKYKYFINNSIKHCMNSNEFCQGETFLYVPTTKQCIGECPSGLEKIFKNNCLYDCPKNAILVNGECSCGDKNWYAVSDKNFICLSGECIESHPVLVSDTKQCLKECRNTEYYILVNNKCYHSCNSFPNTHVFDIPSFLEEYKYSSTTCLCNDPWYYDEELGENHCPNIDEINSCSDYSSFSFKYMIRSTKQCVTACPSKYPFSFNGECFYDCSSEIKNAPEYQYDNMKVDYSSKKCICENLWKYDHDKVICLTDNYCGDEYLEIHDTRQCIQEETCPNYSPLILNKICYSSCPTNSHYNDTIRGKCICDNLWYITTNNKIPCLPKSVEKCPDPYYYQIFNTKECIMPQDTDTKCPDNFPYVFNYICYEKNCPENTKPENENSKKCICDETKGKWYKLYHGNGKAYLYCGLKECPEIKPNLLEDSKRCTYNCDEDDEAVENKWSYKGICYKDCPDYTYKINVGHKYCSFYQLNEANSLEQLRNYVSVQVKELYEEGPIGGVLYNNYDASLQIYSFNKNSIDRELTLKSNLSYIDLDTCLDKIYEDQNLSENDTIYVVKYDLLNNNPAQSSGNDDNTQQNSNSGDNSNENNENSNSNKNNYDYFLANQVEYEFYSSKTLNRIEVSVCEPNEIIISYPISYTLNKFDDSSFGINNNEYKNKFQIGKDLYHKNNNIDTFNFNNSVYKNICLPVEINGKDLVLEDRYEYLYPNNVSLCENNCSVYYTDYELARINCRCNYKEVFDFNREQTPANDLLNDPNFVTPSQSGANAEIIKCLSEFSVKDGIIKNEAFYYCAIITLVEISMVFVAVFHGIKSVSINITNLISKFNIKTNMGNNLKINNNKLNNDKNIISTSHRILNNPPRKGNNDINIEKEKKVEVIGNIINKKNIDIMNYNKKHIDNDYETDNNDDAESEDINYGIGKKNDGMTLNIKNTNNVINNKNQNMNDDLIGKVEFMPMKYNFKYFKPSDKGVIKKMYKNQLPFKISPSTKYLLERKEDINYEPDYLEGPFLPSQNIIEIIDNEKLDIIDKDDNQNTKVNINNNNNNLIGNKPNTKVKLRDIKNSKDMNTEKEFISIKKINPTKRKKEVTFFVQDYNEPKEKKKLDDNIGLYTLIKREQALLRVPYKKYLEKDHSNLLSIFLSEIMDKIYLIKICCFLKPFEIFSVHLSLYLLYHLLLLTLLCSFFTIKTIKKIWAETNYPQLNFYLLYGFLANIVIWAIYKVFICLLDAQDKVKELVKMKNELNTGDNKENVNIDDLTENNEDINEELVQKKYDDLIKMIKIRTIIFFVIGFLLTVFCFIYLISFFAFYTGTKSKVLKSYYIALIEIVLIKLVYGIVLASLRIAAEGNQIENIYKIVYICDKYVS